MKEFAPSQLLAGDNLSSAPTGLARPRFEDWIAARPELWCAGSAVQREMFAESADALDR